MSPFRTAVDGQRIDAAWQGPPPDAAPTLVLLHEGLGCVATWRDFPRALAEQTGCGVLAYSRPGYGGSTPVKPPWPLDYMHREAMRVLPAVLDQAGVRTAILIGHSDGASIATIYAGGVQDFRIAGVVLMAPHFFTEDLGQRNIAAAREAYEHGDLRQKLQRFHQDVDSTFYGWNGAWLDPDFAAWRIDDHLAYIRVPMLLIQGADDQYGTLAQIRAAQDLTYCPVETIILPGCRHSPHLDRPEATLAAVAAFVRSLIAS